MIELSSKERLVRQAKGQDVDRVPTLGGWIGGVEVVADLAEITVESYLDNPFQGMIKAHKALGIDGMFNPIMHTTIKQVRTSYVLEEEHLEVEPEILLEKANALPDTEREVLADFSAIKVEQNYRNYFESAFKNWEGLVPIPNFWNIGGPFPLYQEYGYNAFFMACASYPESIRKIWWAQSLLARESAKILAPLYKEYDLVPLMFCGEDLCNNKGPMVSPDFLRENYFPLVKEIIQPLVDSGVRLIHHCDGNVSPLIEDFFSIGFSGLQGFQYELDDVDPCKFKQLGKNMGIDILFFMGLSVSRTLPFGSQEDIQEEIEYFLDITDGGKGMFLCTSNVTGVEVPPDNLRTAYSYIKKCSQRKRVMNTRRHWPEISGKRSATGTTRTRP